MPSVLVNTIKAFQGIILKIALSMKKPPDWRRFEFQGFSGWAWVIIRPSFARSLSRRNSLICAINAPRPLFAFWLHRYIIFQLWQCLLINDGCVGSTITRFMSVISPPKSNFSATPRWSALKFKGFECSVEHCCVGWLIDVIGFCRSCQLFKPLGSLMR